MHEPPETPTRSDLDEGEISLLEILNLFLRRRHLILGAALGLAVLAGLLGLMSGRTWIANASFVPQGSDSSQGRLATLAGQFGVNVLAGEAAGQSPAFYAELLRSREILRPVAEEQYEFVGGEPGSGDAVSMSGDLPSLLGIEGSTPELRTMAVVGWLRDEAIEVRTAPETGVVGFSVETPWPGLSYEIAQQLIMLVNEFNLETRQSRAAAERTFIEGRLGEADDSLLAAETRLEAFLQSNRQFENSPELLFRHDRLQRQVARQQQVVTSLAQGFEEARVSEVRNTPVITVVESPERPHVPKPRGVVLKSGIGFLLGGVLGFFWALGSEMMRREEDRHSETYREFRSLWADSLRDVRRLGRRS